MGMGFQFEQHRLGLWDLSWDLKKTICWEMGLGPPLHDPLSTCPFTQGLTFPYSAAFSRWKTVAEDLKLHAVNFNIKQTKTKLENKTVSDSNTYHVLLNI